MKKFFVLLLLVSFLLSSSGLSFAAAEVSKGFPIREDSSYRLGPEDQISIAVWRQPELCFSLIQIRPNGYISFPLVGDVKAEGKTCQELENYLNEKLSPYYVSPNVSVNLLKKRMYRVYVVGQVKLPGMFDMSKPQATVSEVLALAGGSTDKAALHRCLIQREGRDIKINLFKLLKEGDTAEDLPLQENDVLLVPEMNHRIAVVGEVKKPGVYDLREGDTLVEALAEAGWFGTHAKVSHIDIIRRGPNGTEERIFVDFREIRNTNSKNLNEKFALKTGDIVHVARLGGPTFDQMTQLFNFAYFITIFLDNL